LSIRWSPTSVVAQQRSLLPDGSTLRILSWSTVKWFP
jgi:hypothetical protein